MIRNWTAIARVSAFVAACCATSAVAQPLQQPAPASQPAPHRILWIARFTGEVKAASAIARTQKADADALQYTGLFDSVTTFEKDAVQPQGTWALAANELGYGAGSAAARAIIGYGAGRSFLEMEYSLTDPSGKVVWSQKIKTKPPFFGSYGEVGATQNQRQALDEQPQRLSEALAGFFGATPPGRH